MERRERMGANSLPPINYPADDEAPSGEFVRLLVVPILVTVLLAGGVYWVRQVPAGSMTSSSPSSTVQVRLLPRPDPMPIPAEAAPQSAALSSNSRQQPPSERPEQPAIDDTRVSPPARALASLEPNAAAAIKAVPAAVSNPPSSVALKFQQNLLRHIERYRHYPSAARSARLEGTVQVLFVMRRDGAVLDAWVKTSAGQMILDIEAIETIRRAAPLPPIPAELPDRLNIMLPVAFVLPQ